MLKSLAQACWDILCLVTCLPQAPLPVLASLSPAVSIYSTASANARLALLVRARRLVKPDNRPGNACHIGGGKGQVSDPGLHENPGNQYRTPSQYRQHGHGRKFQSLASKSWDGGNGKPANNDKPCADICRLSRPGDTKFKINANQVSAQETLPPVPAHL